MNSGYITVRCPRCSSTLEIVSSGVITDIFLCPACLEGEIRYSRNQPVIEKQSTTIPEKQIFGYYATADGDYTANWRQEWEKKNAEAFPLWGKRVHLN